MNAGRHPTRGACAVWIGVIYAVVASLWILTSQVVHVSALQTFRGLLFIALTAAMTSFVTRTATAHRHAGAAASASSGGAAMEQVLAARHAYIIIRASPPLIALAVLALAIAAAGYLMFEYGKDAIKREKQGEIAAIAELKTNEIAQWIAKQRADAVAFGRNSFIAEVTEDWLRRGAPPDDTGRRLLARMRSYTETAGYVSAALVDTQGRVRLVTDGPSERPAMAVEAMQARAPLLSELYRARSGEIALDLVSPLLLSEGEEMRVVGALVLRIDPGQYLFPLIESWPDTTRSGETLIARREGDEVVFLNELRHRPDTALRLRLPWAETELAVAMPSRGPEGVVEARDYRGVPVLAAVREIPGSAWFMVAKIDTEEVYAGIRKLARTVSALVAMFLAVTLAAFALSWRQQRALYLATQSRLALEREALVQHFDYLAKYANDIILLLDEQGRIVEVNDRAVSAYGYTHEELLLRNIRDLRAPETLAAFESQFQRVGQPGGLLFETEHQRKDGRRFAVEVNARAITVDGRTFCQSIIRDITERKRAEEALKLERGKLEAALQNIPTGVVLCSREGELLWMNRAGLRYHRFDTLEQMFREPDRYVEEWELRYLDGRVVPAEQWPLARAVRGEYVRDFEAHLHHRPSGQHWIGSYTAVPVLGSGGELVYIVLTVQNITERKQAEAQLLQAHKMEAVGQLTGGVAHDFNNLLTVILGNLELLDEMLGDAGQEIRELLTDAISAARDGAELTQRLLAFSREQPLQEKLVDINERLGGIRPLLHRTMREDIELRIESDPDMRPVRADPEQLENALLNLVINARDAMPGGGTLTIATARRSIGPDEVAGLAAGDYVTIAVSDSGVGMTPEVAARAFEPFFTTKARGKGSGLGLSMVYGFARRSGGTVLLRSVLGEGTTVSLLLPAAPADVRRIERKSGEEQASVLPRGSETILLAEDEPLVRKLARRGLSELGYEVLEAENAAQAMQAFETGAAVDLLFSDIVMPGPMNGRELARWVAQGRFGSKVLLTTGFSEEEAGEPSGENEDFQVLKKPYSKKELALAVRAVLDGQAVRGLPREVPAARP